MADDHTDSDFEIQALLATSNAENQADDAGYESPSNSTKKTNFLKPWQQNTCPKTRQAVLYRLSLLLS